LRGRHGRDASWHIVSAAWEFEIVQGGSAKCSYHCRLPVLSIGGAQVATSSFSATLREARWVVETLWMLLQRLLLLLLTLGESLNSSISLIRLNATSNWAAAWLRSIATDKAFSNKNGALRNPCHLILGRVAEQDVRAASLARIICGLPLRFEPAVDAALLLRA
jgi:hypothetical protein